MQAVSPTPDFQPLPPAVQQPEPERHAAYDWQWTAVPCALNAIFIPFDCARTAYAFFHAKATGDKDGELQAAVRLAGMPVAFLHALSSVYAYAVQLGYILQSSYVEQFVPFLDLIAAPTLGLGIGLCVIEGIYESVCLAHAVELWQNLLTNHLGAIDELIKSVNDDNFLELLEHHPGVASYYNTLQDQMGMRRIDKLNQIRDWLLIENRGFFQKRFLEDENAYRSLERRVRPWCAQKIRNELMPLLGVLSSEQTTVEAREHARTQAQNILNSVSIQCKKKLIIHIVGLAALTLAAVGFILTLVACPALIPFVLITVAGLLSTFTYLWAGGTLDKEGWTFSIGDAIPPIGWIQRRIQSCFAEKEGSAV